MITLLIRFKATDSLTMTCLCNKCGATRQLVAVIDLRVSKTSVECFKPLLLWHPKPNVFGISIAVASADASAGGASARGTPAAGVITATDTSPTTDDFSVTDDSPTVDISSAVASFTGDIYKMYLKRIQRIKN